MARPTFFPAAHSARLVVVVAVLAASTQPSACGSNYFWSGDATGNWNDASKWTGGPVGGFPSIQDSATFQTASANVTVSLGLSASRGQQSVGFLDFRGPHATTFQGGVAGGPGAFNILTLTGDGAGGGGITLEQSSGGVTIGTATGGVQVNVAGSQTILNDSSLTFNNGIAGVSTGTNVLNFGGGATGTTTLNGSITDSTTESQSGSLVAVVISGTGVLQFSGPNGYSGGTTLNSGYLFLGQDNGLGTAAQTLRINGGTLAANGTARTIPAAISVVVGGDFALGFPLGGQDQAITFNGTVDLGSTRSITVNSEATFAGAVSNGGIIKLGTATLTLAASGNTYAGPTTINAGTLSVTNTAGSATGGGSVTVNGGSVFGTLKGTGIITGPVTINAGATATQNAIINPGTPATNGLSTLMLNGGLAMHGTYNATVDPNGTASSLLAVTGILDLTGGFSTLNVSLSAAGTPSATYTLATFGSLNGTFAATNLPTSYVVNYNPTSITISPVPEPAFVLVVCAAGAAICVRRRHAFLHP